jgi:hypothetical protein
MPPADPTSRTVSCPRPRSVWPSRRCCLPRSHPFTVWRLERLYRIGLFVADGRAEERLASPAEASPDPVCPAH